MTPQGLEKESMEKVQKNIKECELRRTMILSTT
jgi:hypothetical protein